MSDLLTLKKEISQLSDQELTDLLMGIRQTRRTIKPKADSSVAKKATAPKKEASTETLLSGLNKETAALLLATLRGK
jgi:BRCT domain type II-containing protein